MMYFSLQPWCEDICNSPALSAIFLPSFPPRPSCSFSLTLVCCQFSRHAAAARTNRTWQRRPHRQIKRQAWERMVFPLLRYCRCPFLFNLHISFHILTLWGSSQCSQQLIHLCDWLSGVETGRQQPIVASHFQVLGLRLTNLSLESTSAPLKYRSIIWAKVRHRAQRLYIIHFNLKGPLTRNSRVQMRSCSQES